MPRDPAQTREAFDRLRSALDARPNAALVAIVIDVTYPGSRPWVQVATVGADPSVIDAASVELRREFSKQLERQEQTPPRRLMPGRDDG